MAFDFNSFEPGSIKDFVKGVLSALADVARDWFADNRDAIKGYVSAAAAGVIQTKANLAAGVIGKTEADALLKVEKITLRIQLSALRYRTFELQQALLDTAVKALGYAVFNLTGLNIVPSLVRTG